MCVEFSKFLVKKDLLLSRLSKFDDKPEFYAIWKTSFINIMEELDVTPMEEMDLLVKYLGPVSSHYAISLRAANATQPQRCLVRIWERLDERFACPNMVQASVQKKLDSFPMLSNKDHKALFYLSDIITEIESIKENKDYSTLFSYNDSSNGVSPIVNKLPYNLQEKWATEAIKFKRKYMYGVPYPPFTFFVSFIIKRPR